MTSPVKHSVTYSSELENDISEQRDLIANLHALYYCVHRELTTATNDMLNKKMPSATDCYKTIREWIFEYDNKLTVEKVAEHISGAEDYLKEMILSRKQCEELDAEAEHLRVGFV